MKVSRTLGAAVYLAVLATWIGVQDLAQADDEKKAAQPRRTRVEVRELKRGDAEAEDAQSEPEGAKRRVIAVRVHTHDGLNEKVETILKDAGLKGEQLEKACEEILEACKATCHVKPAIGAGFGAWALPKAQLEAAMVIGADGKQQKIELKRIDIPWKQAEGATPQEIQKKIQAQIAIALKETGLSEEQLEKVNKALEQLDQARGHITKPIGPMALRLRAVRAAAANKYMIGLSCAQVNEELRKQLKLDESVGLVVDSVFDDTPAEKAGLQKGDVVTEVGGKVVAGIENLVDAVQAAGKDEKKVSLTVIRDGKKKTVQVGPAESKDMEITIDADIEDEAIGNLRKRLQIDTESGSITIPHGIAGFGELGPGIITEWEMSKENGAQMQSLKKELEELRQQVKELTGELEKLKNADAEN